MTKEAARFAAIIKGWGPTINRAVAKSGRRIPGDGDGDGIPYENRGKKGKYNAAAEQARGEKAMAHVLATHSDVHEAMTTPSGRKVSFLWGKENGNGRGYGIAHASREDQHHGLRITQAIPAVLANGVESEDHHPRDKTGTGRNTNPRVNVDYEGVRVTLVQERHGRNIEWVLTAFEVSDLKKMKVSRCLAACTKSTEGLRKRALTVSAALGSGTGQTIALPHSLLKSNTHRWPAGAPGGRGGEFAPSGVSGGGAVRSNGRAHPAPLDTSRFSQAHPAVPRINRRMQQMDDMAAAGNLDFIRTMRTSRGNSYERTVDDYRNQLIGHFDGQARRAVATGTLPSPPPVPPAAAAATAPQPAAAPAATAPSDRRQTAPAAPQLTGSNMQNSALLSAQRHINRLSNIAQTSQNPLEDLQRQSIGAANTNTYLRQAQGYHAALIAHFSQGEQASTAPQAPASARAPVAGHDARQPTATTPVQAPARPPRAARGAVAAARLERDARVLEASRQHLDPVGASRAAVNAAVFRGPTQRMAYMNAFRATATGQDVPPQRTAIRRNAAALGAEHARMWMAAMNGQPPAQAAAPAPAAGAPAAPVQSSGGRAALHTGEGGVQYHTATGRMTGPNETFLNGVNVRNSTFVDNGKMMTVDHAATSSIAANPDGLTVHDLGFIPRPNVPLNGVTVRREGSQVGTSGPITPWPSAAARNLANAYLSQPSSLQSRARDYQKGDWRPETPERRAQREAAARAEDARLANLQREAAAKEAARRASIPEDFRVRGTPGANVESATIGVSGSGFSTPQLQTKAAAENFAKRLIADYGLGVKFSVAGSISGRSAEIHWTGDDNTRMTRNFTQNADGSLEVYHAYFKAGQRGEGAGKRFFRVAMGEYMAMGVKKVGVTANIDVGGYAWARYGYLPKRQEDWDSLRNGLKYKLEGFKRSGDLSPEGYAKMKAHLDNPDKRTLWKVCDMKDPNGFEVGKKLLLGTTWSGQITLNDQEQMRRFTDYVSRG